MMKLTEQQEIVIGQAVLKALKTTFHPTLPPHVTQSIVAIVMSEVMGLPIVTGMPDDF